MSCGCVNVGRMNRLCSCMDTASCECWWRESILSYMCAVQKSESKSSLARTLSAVLSSHFNLKPRVQKRISAGFHSTDCILIGSVSDVLSESPKCYVSWSKKLSILYIITKFKYEFNSISKLPIVVIPVLENK